MSNDRIMRTDESPKGFDTIAVNQGQISAYADSAAAPGVDTTVTSALHKITQAMVDCGWFVTISGSTASQYDGTFKVTRIIDVNNFDMVFVFGTDAGDGAFLVEYIYPINPTYLIAARVIRPSGGGVFTTYQPLDPKNLQDSEIFWGDDKAVGTDEFDAGENHVISGMKVTGNPVLATEETRVIIAEIKVRP